MAQIITVNGIQYLIADDGTATPVTAAAATPATPVAAAPFTVVATRKADGTESLPAPIREAMQAAPDGRRQEYGRLAAAFHAVPQYACNATARDVQAADGTLRTVGHGFITPRDAGTPCPSNGCKGTILA